MNDPEYVPMVGDSRVLYHCLACGSLVVNMARHTQWHREQSTRPSAAEPPYDWTGAAWNGT